MPSAVRIAAVQAGVPGAKNNSINGEEIHVGGWYTSQSGKTRPAMAHGCFGIVNSDNSPSNPSNSTVTNVVNTIIDEVNNSTTTFILPGLVIVIR